MGAKLLVLSGPDEKKTFPLTDDATITIGRGDTATIKLSDPTISRNHCTIEYYGGTAILKDNSSKTGTRVNTKSITEHVLQFDEVITLGTTKLRFQVVALAAPKTADKTEDSDDIEELRKMAGGKLGHFEVGAVVGIGTSGVVFKANDIKDSREVALKVYTPEFAEDEESKNRFIRAAKTMMPMRHTNLVTLYGAGKTGPYCWMAMEYVEGENLKETIARIGKRGKLDWRPALRMSLDLSRGLYYIHNENIIHRSLSPGNILFSRSGTIKLGSLILAKALSGALAKDVTVGGNFLGDVQYLAPEQVGAGGAVDVRADIYALGALVYALLTGKPPFQGNTPLETATWILSRPPTTPRKFDPTIPEPLEKIVLKMLAKRPEERFQNAGGFAE